MSLVSLLKLMTLRTFGAFNKKKLPLFDKSLMILEYLHQIILTFKGMRFCSIFGSNHKRVWKTDRKTPLPESTLNNGFRHSGFPANFLKAFKNVELLHCRRT